MEASGASGRDDRQPSGSGNAAPAETLPAVTVPVGGGAIRGMGEKFAVNPVTGTTSLTVPIALSPGRSGHAPDLALSYDSGAGNGPFGFGWSLSLPAITRRTDRGLPRYVDGDESDVFVLSGAEDLVPVLDASGQRASPLARTVHGSTCLVSRYRPRVEGLFARVERWLNTGTGRSHWRTISRTNVTSLYGIDDGSRIADPDDPRRCFSYLIARSWDDRGNVTVYDYLPEDGEGIDLTQANEANRPAAARTAQRYLKSIRYGNVQPYFPGWGADGQETPLPGSWCFQVVVDYGDHRADPPSPVPDHRPWPARPDPFSSCRAGFEIRTYRRAHRILLFHDFPGEPTAGTDLLVASTDLTYGDEQAPPDPHSPIYSKLVAIVQTGHRRDGSVRSRSLPPLELAYSEPQVQADVLALDPDSGAGLPEGVDGARYRWVDLDGEGLNGILSDSGGSWTYRRNLSPANQVGQPGGSAATRARFEPGEVLPLLPQGAALGRQQLLDVDGSGRLDLVQLDGPVPGFSRRTDSGWEPFQRFRSLPALDWASPNVRLVDLTGNGLADVLVTEDGLFTLYASLGLDGFAGAELVSTPGDEDRGPRLVLADGTQTMFLADMSGDGLSDLVRVRNGEVSYWPNLGYGHFGARVVMDRAPRFTSDELFDPRRVRLADVDGSGTADLVYAGPDQVSVWFNQSGSSWSALNPVAVLPSLADPGCVEVTDLLGTGTACLVWSSPLPGDTAQPLRYVDLMGGQKPHLLVQVRNNLGAETRLTYAPSTRFFVADELAGTPWVTRLPHVVHVLERVESIDWIGRSRAVTRYAYHHGYFDGFEREFRGFGLVERWDTEELGSETAFPDAGAVNWDAASWSPPTRTRTWFHTGAFEQAASLGQQYAHEYWREPGAAGGAALPDSVLPAGLSAAELREAHRALKGQTLRTEVYAEDGSANAANPYTVIEQNLTVVALQPQGPNRHAVFFAHPREAVSFHYERSPSDPRVTHEVTLQVDPYGNVERAVSIGYPRRPGYPAPEPALSATWQGMLASDQGRLHVRGAESRYTVALTDPAAFPDVHRTPLLASRTEAEITGVAPAAGVFGFDEFDKRPDGIWATVWNVQHDVPYESVPSADMDGDGPGPGSPTRRIVAETRVLYRRDDLTSLLGPGELQPLALPGETYREALTPGLLGGIFGPPVAGTTLREGGYVQVSGETGWWAPSGQLRYSAGDADDPATELGEARKHFFLPRRAIDPFDAITRVDYDPYDLLVATATDPVGNATSASGDYRVLRPALVTDPNGNRVAVAFDVLGQVAGTAVMGKVAESLGDSLAMPGPQPFPADLDDATVIAHLGDPLADPGALLGDATTRIVYDHDAFNRSRLAGAQPAPPAVYTLARETHVSDLAPGQVTRYQHAFSYSDGFGREVQRKAQAEPGPLTDGGTSVSPRWVGSGWTIFDNKGRPVRKYEPFFSATSGFEFAAQVGVSSVLFHDPPGRQVAVLHPDSSWEKVVFDPWRQDSWDVNDTVLVSDPRGDPDVGDHFRRLLGTAGGFLSWYDKRIGGTFGATPYERAAQQDAAQKAATHAATPAAAHYDALGRTCLTVADNGGGSRFPGRTALDTEGRPLAVFDALGRRAVEHCLRVPTAGGGRQYLAGVDMIGNPLHQVGMDGGARRVLADVGGKPIRSWDARGHAFRVVYDASRRPTHRFVSTGGGPETLLERLAYGERHPEANLCGRLVRHYDTAGVVMTGRFDYKGNPLTSTRQLAADYHQSPDWSLLAAVTDLAALDATAAPLLDPADRFQAATTYDALNRPIQSVTPHSASMLPNVIQPAYNEANLLDRVDVWLQQAAAPAGLLDPATADRHPVTGTGYNARGQRVQVAYGNGTVTSYTYDPATFRLVHLTTTRPDPQADQRVVQDLAYFFDPAGNATRIHDTADTQNVIFFGNQRVEPSNDYTYDPTYRLIAAAGREHLGQAGGQPLPAQQVTDDDSFRMGLPQPGDGNAMGNYTETYGYDDVGNVRSVGHTAASGSWTRLYGYDERSRIDPNEGSNRLSWTSAPNPPANGPSRVTYGHDAHGNVTAMPHLPLMAWDEQDRLVASSRQVVNAGVPETTFYTYDAGGQRVVKATDSMNVAGTRGMLESERIYLGAVELHRSFGMQPFVRETLRVEAASQVVCLVETRTAGTDPGAALLVRYQHTNHLGSAVLELDDWTAIITYEEYFPYGSTSYQAVRKATETPKRYRYTGKERDEESGLYYHGARYYAPWLGRWTSCDRAPRHAHENLYCYVSNGPIRFTDPTGSWQVEGHFGLTVIAGVFAGATPGNVMEAAVANQSRDDLFGTNAIYAKIAAAVLLTGPIMWLPASPARDLMNRTNNMHAINMSEGWSEMVAWAGIRNHDVILLGLGMHTAADVYPHSDLSGRLTWGHQNGVNEDNTPSRMWSTAADQTWRNPNKAEASEEQLRSLWWSFQGHTESLPALSRDQLTLLGSYVHATTVEEAAAALTEILRTAGWSDKDITTATELFRSKEARLAQWETMLEAGGRSSETEANFIWDTMKGGWNDSLLNNTPGPTPSKDLPPLPAGRRPDYGESEPYQPYVMPFGAEP